ncbi:protein ALP1-like [Haliotis rufescens]|uniref:protein ALP1-like n=1 Tax=Haliotis rufescens TaxID=6454 RepID=UPI00201EA13C|nr:protein ALP1-like [Haliotis rufescens]
MTRETFYFLCQELQESLPNVPFREGLDIDHKVAVAVYWLTSSAESRAFANLFGVGKSTVWKCLRDVCEALTVTMMLNYVKFPKEDDLKAGLDGFESAWGFPNCDLDWTSIPIIGPVHVHGDYRNRKGFYSIILQAVCDHKCIFSDINIGWPGRVHDARVFGFSELFHKGENNHLFPKWQRKLTTPDKEIIMPITLVANAVHPLKPWLLKPYTNQANLTPPQRQFNYRLSRARLTIENAFGRLKGRWLCLQKRLDVSVDSRDDLCIVAYS